MSHDRHSLLSTGTASTLMLMPKGRAHQVDQDVVPFSEASLWALR